MRGTTSDGQKSTGAISKAFAILDAVARSTKESSVTGLAAQTGMPKASIHRLLQQLEEVGLVRRGLDEKTYFIGHALKRLSIDTVGTLSRCGTVREIIASLVEDIDETCNLGVLDGSEVLYLERVECRQPLRLLLSSGSRVPLHATATGKLILAYLPEGKAEQLIGDRELEAFTEATLTNKMLRQELSNIRKSGHSVNRQESIHGVFGVAVPVFDASGHVIAGLAAHAPTSRLDDANYERVLPKLKVAADQISEFYAAS